MCLGVELLLHAYTSVWSKMDRAQCDPQFPIPSLAPPSQTVQMRNRRRSLYQTRWRKQHGMCQSKTQAFLDWQGVTPHATSPMTWLPVVRCIGDSQPEKGPTVTSWRGRITICRSSIRHTSVKEYPVTAVLLNGTCKHSEKDMSIMTLR